jgi:hypothetical protein
MRRVRAVGSLLIALLIFVAGCVGATSSGPVESMTTATSSNSPSGASAAPSTSAASSASSVTSAPTSASTSTSLPTLAAATQGDWTQIQWRRVPSAPSGLGNVFGWSGGFVGFTFDFGALKIVPWSSADGETWSSGPALDTTDLKAGVAGWRAMTEQAFAPATPDPDVTCRLDMESLSQGPTTLVLKGWLSCQAPCGTWWVGPALWVSKDSLDLARVDTSPLGVTAAGRDSGQVSTLPYLSGGSAGFVAITGSSSVALSSDGTTWHNAADVPIPTGADSIHLDSVAGFSGGFVVSGAIEVAHYCALALDGSPVHAGIWWSVDGNSWTLANVSPSLTCGSAMVYLDRLSDHALLATEDCLSPDSVSTYLAWVSTDGQEWTQLAYGDALARVQVLSDGTTAVGYIPTEGLGSVARFCYFDSRLLPVELNQTGAVPPAGFPTLGYSGGRVLLVQDGMIWLGTLS